MAFNNRYQENQMMNKSYFSAFYGVTEANNKFSGIPKNQITFEQNIECFLLSSRAFFTVLEVVRMILEC